MRNGFFNTSIGRSIQILNFALNDFEIPIHYCGKPKRINQVLEERGLWKEGLHLKCRSTDLERKKHDSSINDCINLRNGQCCTRSLMAIQPDFQ